MNSNKKTILITGASSGLGAALAIQYASTNCRLFLFGRCEERLNKIQQICKELKAETKIIVSDVCDKSHMNKEITKICEEFGVDIIIACAGVSAGTLNGVESTEQIEKIFDTNLQGTLNTVIPALKFMVESKKGTIVLLSSMAGLIGLASSPSYSASKAAVKVFGDGLRAYLKQFNVKLCVCIPGYIDTPMTQVNKFPMPFKISAQVAAKLIIKDIERAKPIIAFPLIMYVMLKVASLLPSFILDYINSKLPAKAPL